MCRNKSNMIRHLQGKHAQADFPCTLCERTFNTANTRQIHLKKLHGITLTAKEIARMAEEREQMAAGAPQYPQEQLQ